MILAATGMQREAKAIARTGAMPVVSGGNAAQLRERLEAAAPPARGIISIGIAGALAPELRVGDWIVADAVAGHGPTDIGWTERLIALLTGAKSGTVIGSDTMAVTAADKAALYGRLAPVIPAKAGISLPSSIGGKKKRGPSFRWDDGKRRDDGDALAVDMESHIAAQVAARHRLPFAVVRIISDRADQDLPIAVTRGIKPDGSLALLPVLRSLAADPRQLPALIRTGRDAAIAMRSLFRACDVLARAGVGLPDRR